ncbi:hypothetical protein CLCR_10304 [Cladophialophora carrionii]|uniref:Uncharacterized protein n=1 Tax=Cladophialophora carrionii TaxID=86049 RepID=A0A1C1CZS5_9EURO|nr:hypothetical protein CLCR_10304 [Cladophialophora carrionii]
MVTTRLGSRIDASSPQSVNKRRRFSSVEADDHIVVEVPVHEPKAVKEREISGEVVPGHESDEDAAPEVLSSRDAARQARELPNRSLRHASNKRRRAAEEHLPVGKPGLTPSVPGESKPENAPMSGAASLQPDEVLPQNEASMTRILQPLAEEIRPLSTINSENGVSNVDAARIPVEVTENTAVLDDQKSETAQFLPNMAKNGGGDEAPTPAPELAAEGKTALVTNEPGDTLDSVPQMRSLGDVTPRAGDEVLEKTPMNEPQSAIEPDRSLPGDSTTQLRVEALLQNSKDKAVSQPAGHNPTLSMPEADMQTIGTTSTQEDQISGTPRSSTSSVITPVWRTRAYDETPLTAVQSPSLAPAVKATHARSNTLPRPQDLISRRPKTTSLQRYRDRLLNRHQRTTNWGPPGFRKTKFVGA